MNRLGFALSIVAVVASAAWAYHINYRTKQALTRLDDLRAEIAAEREATGILRVEWAYLNRHERLRRLVELNNAELGLEPMGPQHFGDAAAVPFPPRPSEWMTEPPAPAGAPQGEGIAPMAQAAPSPVVDPVAGPVPETQTLALADAPMPPPRPLGRSKP